MTIWWQPWTASSISLLSTHTRKRVLQFQTSPALFSSGAIIQRSTPTTSLILLSLTAPVPVSFWGVRIAQIPVRYRFSSLLTDTWLGRVRDSFTSNDSPSDKLASWHPKAEFHAKDFDSSWSSVFFSNLFIMCLFLFFSHCISLYVSSWA